MPFAVLDYTGYPVWSRKKENNAATVWRERHADIPALIQHFMMKNAREVGLAEVPRLVPGAIDKLMHYPWPGNVRELKNAVERPLILSGGKPLVFEEIGVPGNTISSVMPLLNGAEVQGLDQAVAKHTSSRHWK